MTFSFFFACMHCTTFYKSAHKIKLFPESKIPFQSFFSLHFLHKQIFTVSLHSFSQTVSVYLFMSAWIEAFLRYELREFFSFFRVLKKKMKKATKKWRKIITIMYLTSWISLIRTSYHYSLIWSTVKPVCFIRYFMWDPP